ncbi:uncharacterized protein BDZ99DRAFT_186901 [Mytilinidion resinicola]|uniref:Secreted protein n=1 Tax=Mytilinidion resinicola TaxID=574789 RepID=A0A6A6Z420_9PEZI|nr:uncharacterized protein BDZ99DRAFT_186901 [Mytilinidion resinicola]KAF2814905.1 hypothetical protein BDZ99DRAFT_186901 [Mytilinidion resinicola]
MALQATRLPLALAFNLPLPGQASSDSMALTICIETAVIGCCDFPCHHLTRKDLFVYRFQGIRYSFSPLEKSTYKSPHSNHAALDGRFLSASYLTVST